MMAFFMGMSGVTYSLGFWQGSLFLVRGEISIEDMLTTIMVMLIGSMNVGYISPYIQAFNTALNTATGLMTVIDREPTIDATDEMTGDQPESCAGDFESLNVRFRAGQTTAIVGPSGSGKSTLFGLLARWYDPVGGTISLDGRDTTSLNLHWLRKQMGVVGQEPVLLAGSVYDNIRSGLAGTIYENSEDSVQREMVIKAAKISYAHTFIEEQLVDGYDTDVGQGALLLSGGQKQRIAIARAIVSEPKSESGPLYAPCLGTKY
jgi:ATP-binding cassette subfamily B (MDR/TAP) protein 1